jgi:hypothetical protein
VGFGRDISFAPGSWYLVAEFFGLVALLGVAFAVTFAGLEWKTLTAR